MRRLLGNPACVGVVVILILAAAMLSVRTGGGGHPAIFEEGLSLEAAEQRAAASGRLVMVYATADWCGPCRGFKRTTLSNRRVEAWVREHAEPVYLDVDRQTQAAERFRITGIPAVIFLRGGREVARTVGAIDAEEFLARAKAADQAPLNPAD